MSTTLEVDLLTPKQAARRLGVAVQTLAIWRCQGKGPPYVRVGDRMVRYAIHALEDFVRAGGPIGEAN